MCFSIGGEYDMFILIAPIMKAWVKILRGSFSCVLYIVFAWACWFSGSGGFFVSAIRKTI